jgi:hypothetical protein
MVRPSLRARYPTPPPKVMPPIPTEAVSPKPMASPCRAASVVSSPAVSPFSAQAVRWAVSISSAFRSDRSTTIPPSQTL